MRTTLDLPDAVARQAKMLALRRDISLKDLVVVALEHEFDAGTVKPGGRTFDLPLIPSRKPGSCRLSPDDVHEILVREERAAYETSQRH